MHWTRRHRRGRPPHPDVLTPAEWRVLELVREGLPNADIANRLGITVPTVKSHVTSILAKTGVSDRYALAQWDGAPAEAPGRTSRGFAFPLALLSAGSVKVGVGAAAGVLFVVAVFSAYGFFFDETDGAGVSAAVPDEAMVAIIDGLRVTEDEWFLATDSNRRSITLLREWLDKRGDGSLDDDELLSVVRQYLALYDSHSIEAVVLGEVMLEWAAAAHALAEGYRASSTEIEQFVADTWDAHERIEHGELGAAPGAAAGLARVIAAAGEERYWNVVVVDRARRAIVSHSLLEDAGVSPPYDVAFRADLARRAQVQLSSQIGATVSVEEALAFIGDYERLIESLIDSSADAAGDPLPPPPGHPPDTRTGIPEVDAVIDAVLAGDLEGLLDLASPDDVLRPASLLGIASLSCDSVGAVGGQHDMSWIESERVSLFAVAVTSEFADGPLVVFGVRSDAGAVSTRGLQFVASDRFWSVISGCASDPGAMLEHYTESPYLLPPPE